LGNHFAHKNAQRYVSMKQIIFVLNWEFLPHILYFFPIKSDQNFDHYLFWVMYHHLADTHFRIEKVQKVSIIYELF